MFLAFPVNYISCFPSKLHSNFRVFKIAISPQGYAGKAEFFSLKPTSVFRNIDAANYSRTPRLFTIETGMCCRVLASCCVSAKRATGLSLCRKNILSAAREKMACVKFLLKATIFATKYYDSFYRCYFELGLC